MFRIEKWTGTTLLRWGVLGWGVPREDWLNWFSGGTHNCISACSTIFTFQTTKDYPAHRHRATNTSTASNKRLLSKNSDNGLFQLPFHRGIKALPLLFFNIAASPPQHSKCFTCKSCSRNGSMGLQSFGMHERPNILVNLVFLTES